MPTLDPSDNAPRHREHDGPSPKLNVASGRNFRTPLPDLRFEQSYLKSIAPYLHVPLPPSNPSNAGGGSTAGYATTDEHSGLDLIGTPSIYGAPISIRWSGVVWVTVRDQILNPFIQGIVWGVASMYIVPVSARARVYILEQFKTGFGQMSGRRRDDVGWPR